MSEPIGVMKCWECVEKHARDMEHHLEDIVRAMKGDKERVKFEDWIDYIRDIRRYAHTQAKDIATEDLEENPAFHVRFIDLATGKTHEKDIAEREQYDLIKLQREGKISIIEITSIKEKGSEEEVEFSEPIRRERGKEVYVDVYHEKEECHPSSFRVIKPNPEHILTICCPKGQFEAGRCQVGTMAQKLEHLHSEGEGSCPVCGGA